MAAQSASRNHPRDITTYYPPDNRYLVPGSYREGTGYHVPAIFCLVPGTT
jgi:hypothetical protein